MLKNEELYKSISRKTDGKLDIRKTVNILNSKLYYKFAISSKKECNFGGLW